VKFVGCLVLVACFNYYYYYSGMSNNAKPMTVTRSKIGTEQQPSPPVIDNNNGTTLSTKTLTCSLWEVNIDDWWQEHPDWEISETYENSTHTCFQPIQDSVKADFFRQIHAVQFQSSNCSDLLQRFEIGVGFGAAMNRLIHGFHFAFRHKRPFQRSKHWHGFKWMYSSHYNSTHPETNSWDTCPDQDMFCYFLPISPCDYVEKHEDRFPRSIPADVQATSEFRWIQSYFFRPQQHVRQRLHTLLSSLEVLQLELKTPCTAFHVRRTDATTERFARNFYPLSFYIEKGNVTKGTNILLLTDDQSAIEEAALLHPGYNWIYVNRTRHRGHQRKNSHIPSGDMGLELLYILAEIRLVQKCERIIHGTSNMVDTFLNAMQYNQKDPVVHVSVDSDINFKEYKRNSGSQFMKDLNEKLRRAREGGVDQSSFRGSQLSNNTNISTPS
jgi:hypothetical protein